MIQVVGQRNKKRRPKRRRRVHGEEVRGGMEVADVVIVAAIFGIFNVILYVAAISLLREHEKMINEKMKSRRHT